MKYKCIPGDDDAWYLEDTEINIADFLTKKIQVPEGYSLHTHWLAIEGKVPNIPENECEAFEDMPSETIPEVDPATTHQLSLEQQVYYNSVLEALNTGARLESVLDSLHSDSSLTRLIPYISRSIFSMILDSEELSILDRGIKILGALSTNAYLNLEPYLHQIMPAMLSGLMRGDLAQEGHWVYRKNTAGIIAQVCEQFSEYYEDLKARVLKLYVKVLEDPEKAPASHYAAVQGINAFGELCVQNLLVPILPRYFEEILAKKATGKEANLWGMCRSAIIVRNS